MPLASAFSIAVFRVNVVSPSMVIILALILAAGVFGIPGISTLIGSLLIYVPHVLTAVFVLIMGTFLAIFVSRIVSIISGSLGINQTETLSRISQYAIIVFAGIIALKELDIAVIMTQRAKDFIFAGQIYCRLSEAMREWA